MKRGSISRNKIPTLSLWNIDDEKPFNVVLFNSIAPPDMPQYKAHKKSHFVIGYCVEGSFKSYINFNEQEVVAGDARLINPNQIHFVKPANRRKVTVITIAFHKSFCAKLHLSAHVKMLIHAQNVNIGAHGLNYQEDVIALLFRAILQEFRNHKRSSPGITQLMTLLLTLICEQGDVRKEMTKASFIFYSFLQLLDDLSSTTHRVSDYSSKLEISEKSLNRACNTMVQQSAQNIIHQRVNFEAKRQLAYENTSSKEIAYAVGFKTPVQFSKFFRQHNSQTPLEYRKKAQGGFVS